MKRTVTVVHRFGDFVLEAEELRLARGGVAVPLQEKPLLALTALIAGGGEVVGRDELAEAMWGEGTFVDAESGLNTAIKKLREALGDSAASPTWIETVPRKGYRLLVPVATERHVVWTERVSAARHWGTTLAAAGVAAVVGWAVATGVPQAERGAPVLVAQTARYDGTACPTGPKLTPRDAGLGQASLRPTTAEAACRPDRRSRSGSAG